MTTPSSTSAPRNKRGFTLLDPLPDLPYAASDGSSGSLHGYFRGSWGLLFSHPDDFTPICTTELGEVARLASADAFTSRGVKLMGLSCNSVESHRAWIRDVEAYAGQPVQYPIIADESRAIAAELGMLAADDLDKAGMPLTVRTLFVVDPQVRIRLTLTYPASTGRNFVEVLRVLDSLQLGDKHMIATPVNWQKGQRVVVPPTVSDEDAVTKFGELEVEPLPSGQKYLRFTKSGLA